MKIAIIGTGVAGLTAGYVLARAHDIVLFEANDYPGGHTHTVDVASPTGGARVAVDTGFIVHNTRSYPLLTRLFRELGVRTQPTVMSFSMECACGTAWSSRRPWRAGRLLREITRFLRTAGSAEATGLTFDRWLAEEGYSDAFRWHYLVPMTSALWSTAPGQALDFPAAFGIEFFRNHGMLGLRSHRWQSVVGGSREYVRAIVGRLGTPPRLSTPVRSVERDPAGVILHLEEGESVRHDAVVIATHAPTALSLLAEPSRDEARLLGRFRVTENETVLHTDARFLPARPGDRAAWNYQSPGCAGYAVLPTVTYSMNRLQSLAAPEEWCVTLNRTSEIDPGKIAGVYRYAHPQLTLDAIEAQSELGLLNGVQRTAFAGAWQGNGFHEDGVRSGVAAAASFGVAW